MKKAVALVSGGMDSVTALYRANADHEVVAAMSFDYGSKHNHKEIPYARFHAEKLGIAHEVVSLGFMDALFDSHLLKSGGAIPDGHYEAENMKQTVVPFRNGIMLSIAAGYAESQGATDLVIAAHSGDHTIYPDCRESFMQAMSAAVRLGTYAEIVIQRPFVSMTKAEIVTEAVRLKVDLKQTWSCYKGGEIQCGTCATCVERREAFLLAEVEDPTEYVSKGPLPEKP